MDQSKKIKYGIISVFVIIVLIILIGFLIKYFQQTAMGKGFKPGPSVVKFTRVKSTDWQTQLSSVGTVYANRGIMIKATASGEITKIYLPSGSRVSKGDKVFQINPRVLDAQYKQALSAVRFSRQEYQRYQQLVKEGAVTLEALDAKRNQYQSDVANLHKVKQQLALTTIRAPFNGRLGLSQVHLGSYVSEGDPLAYLQKQSGVYVQFSLPGKDAHLVTLGDAVSVSVANHPNSVIHGKVSAIDSAIDAQTRMIKMRASLPAAQLVPGAYAMVSVLVGKPRNVLLLPQEAVVSSVNGDYVFQPVHGVAKQVFVTTGERRQNFVEILSGLKANDQVVDGGQIKVIPGFPITDKGAIQLKNHSKR